MVGQAGQGRGVARTFCAWRLSFPPANACPISLLRREGEEEEARRRRGKKVISGDGNMAPAWHATVARWRGASRHRARKAPAEQRV